MRFEERRSEEVAEGHACMVVAAVSCPQGGPLLGVLCSVAPPWFSFPGVFFFHGWDLAVSGNGKHACFLLPGHSHGFFLQGSKQAIFYTVLVGLRQLHLCFILKRTELLTNVILESFSYFPHSYFQGQ